jgi:CubicO group peptidase (beta-lactamase class C family)
LPSAEELVLLLEPIRERRGLPALAAALATGGGEIVVGAVGVREQGNEARVTPEDKFHLGSCTKSMTATLAGVLVERGELTFETTLGEVFGERVEGMHADWGGVTLEMLLAHRAGLRRDPKPVWRQAPPRELRAEIAAALLGEPPERAPDTETSYSNAGYILAGALLEAVMDQSWEELMRAELFTPLGMASAGFGAPDSKEQGDPLQPRGHLPNLDPIRGWDNLAYYGPAGTMHASLGDWSRYVIQHLRGARGAGGEDLLLSPETFARLQTNHGGDYALGWGATTRPWAGLEGEGRVLTHAGSNTRWYCVAWLAPERNLAALAATNWAGEGAQQACDEAVWALLQSALGLERR